MSDITKLDIDIDRKYIINAENPCSGSKHTEKDSVLFLAKDKAFLEGALPGYREKCIELGSNQEHIDSIDLLIGRVAEFQKNIISKIPDTNHPGEISRCINGENLDSNVEIRYQRFFDTLESTKEVIKSNGIDIIKRYFNSIHDTTKIQLCNLLDTLIFVVNYNAIKSVRLILLDIKLDSTSVSSSFKLDSGELEYIDQQLKQMTRLK